MAIFKRFFSSNKPAILVLDNPDVYRILDLWLKKKPEFSNYQTSHAGTFEIAIEKAKSLGNKLEILISEIKIPGNKRGIDCAREIIKTNRDLSILFYTGDVSYRNEMKALQVKKFLPEASFAFKPFKYEEFFSALKSVVRQ